MRNGEQMCNDVAYPRKIRLDGCHLLTISSAVYYEHGYTPSASVSDVCVCDLIPGSPNCVERLIGVSGDPSCGESACRLITVPPIDLVAAWWPHVV